MAGHVAVFGSSRVGPGSAPYEDAARAGRLLAAAGLTVVTGGYGGSMEAVSQGARAAGGRVVGVTAPGLFPGRPGANPFVTEERQAASLTERIHELLAVDGAIALPGSIGTFTELAVAWNANYLAAMAGRELRPFVAVGPVWAELLRTLGPRLDAPDGLVELAATVDDAVARVVAALVRDA